MADGDPKLEGQDDHVADMADTLVFGRALPREASWSFEEFLRAGIARAQTVSGEVWTDYNEHDPGVTMLEQFCFALTDLAYRTDHSVADLMASVPAEQQAVGTEAADNPPLRPAVGFHSAPMLLSTSAITEGDLRKVVLSHFPEVWNVWIRRKEGSPDRVPSAFQVLIQKSTDPADQQRRLQDADLIAGVWRLLRSEACLGMAFLEPEILESVDLAVSAEIEVDPGEKGAPEAVLAGLLFAIDQVVSPQPRMASYSDLLRQGRPPAEVFDGPLSAHGKIDLAGLPKWPAKPTDDDIRAALLHTGGVLWVSAVQVNTEAAGAEDVAYNLAVSPEGLRGLTVRRGDGGLLGDTPEPARAGADVLNNVQRQVLHRRRQRRFSGAALGGVRREVASLGADQGLERPALGHYRSVQHLFPAIYGLGVYGDSALVETSSEIGSQRALGATKAELNQLRAYLLMFEQFLANYLAQLVNAPRLLSWHEEWKQSYFVQPVPALLDGPAGDPVQEPPGAVDALAGKPGDDAGERLAGYTSGLDCANSNLDPVEERAERAYDHLLARLNERFDNSWLDNLSTYRGRNEKENRALRNKRKRRFLSEYEVLGTRRVASSRALASTSDKPNADGKAAELDLAKPLQPPALVERLELLTGLPKCSLKLIDHGKLGVDPNEDGVGELMIWPPEEARRRYQPAFRIGPSSWSLALADGPSPRHLNLLVEPNSHERFWDTIAHGDVLVEVESGRRGGRFGVQLLEEVAGGTTRLLAKSLDITTSLGEAELLAKQTAEALSMALESGGDREPPRGFNAFPAKFYDHRLTAFLPEEEGANSSVRSYIDTVFRREAPAHLTLDVFWVSKAELSIADAGLREIYIGEEGPGTTLLRRMIESLFYARMFAADGTGKTA